MNEPKITLLDLQRMKTKGRKITMLSINDYPMALLGDRAGLDTILVGDSLGMTVLGYETTVPVTMEEMLHHTKAVTRAVWSGLRRRRHAVHVQRQPNGCRGERGPLHEWRRAPMRSRWKAAAT